MTADGEEYESPRDRYNKKRRAARAAARGPTPTPEEREARAAEAHRRGNAEYAGRNPEKVAAYQAEYRQRKRNADDRAARATETAHAEHLRRRDNERYAANPEPQRQRSRRDYWKDPEASRAAARARYHAFDDERRARRREYAKEWARRKRAQMKRASLASDLNDERNPLTRESAD